MDTPQPIQQPVAAQKTNIIAILSLIFAFLFPLAGFILAIIALVQIGKSGQPGKGLAIAALVISILWGIVAVLIGIAALAYFTVLDPKEFLPNGCIIEQAFTCEGLSASEDGTFRFMLFSDVLGENVADVRVSSDLGSCTPESFTPIGSNAQELTCKSTVFGQRIRSTLQIAYTANGVQKSAIGHLVWRIT